MWKYGIGCLALMAALGWAGCSTKESADSMGEPSGSGGAASVSKSEGSGARVKSPEGSETSTPQVSVAEEGSASKAPKISETPAKTRSEKMSLSDAEWKKRLTPEQYHILRDKGTERAFSGRYWDNKASGVYCCAGCGQELFSSDTKFDSGTGWPSFHTPIKEGNVAEEVDRSFFSVRTEVLCSKCDGHLGHVFNDGPRPTGLRYCLNSEALKLRETKDDS